jgi:hypothetical protein
MVRMLLTGRAVHVCQYWTYGRGQGRGYVPSLGTDEDVSLLRGVDCNIPPDLIGLIAYLYHQVATSFSEAHLQRTLGLSVLGPEQF